MRGASDDDVVEDFDLEQLTGSDEVSGCADVCLTGSGITRRMVVSQNHRMGTGHNGHSEDFPSVDEDGIQDAHSHDDVALDPATGVENEDYEELAIWIEVRIGLHMQPPVIGRLLRCGTVLQLIGSRTFAQCD